jgi:hypothetical protein
MRVFVFLTTFYPLAVYINLDILFITKEMSAQEPAGAHYLHISMKMNKNSSNTKLLGKFWIRRGSTKSVHG